MPIIEVIRHFNPKGERIVTSEKTVFEERKKVKTKGEEIAESII